MDQQTSLFVSYDDTKTDSGAVTMDHLRHTLRIRHIDGRFDTLLSLPERKLTFER